MNSISSTLPQAVYNFIYPVVVNFCGRAVIQLDQVAFKAMNVTQEKVAENAQRVVSIALLIFGLVAVCYLAIKYLSEVARFLGKMQTPATLATEFSSAKEELLIDRRLLDKLELKDGISAKIFLAVEHEGQHLTEAFIIPKIDQQLSQQQIEEQFIAQIDALFDKIQRNIKFNDQCKTKFNIVVFLRDQDLSKGPRFSNVDGEITVHKEECSGYGSSSSSRFVLTDGIQETQCESLNIPFTPQIDAQGDFI